MLKRYQEIVGVLFRLVDACVIAGVWLAAYWLRFDLQIVEVTKGFPPFRQYAGLTPLIVVLWMAVFNSMRVYKSRRMLRRTHEVQLLLKAHGIAILLFIALTYLFSEYKYSRGVMISFGFFGALFLTLFRLTLRNALRALRRKGFNLRHVIAVGEGRAVETLIARLEKFPELGMRVIGVVVQDPEKTPSVGGKPVIGSFAQLAHEVQSRKADQVLISLPRAQYDQLDPVLRSLADETVDIQIVPDIQRTVTDGSTYMV